MVILIWLVWTRQLRKLWRLPWVSGLLLLAAIALPWFVLAQLKYPRFFDYIIIKQHFARYTASTFNSVYPWWFYLMALGILFSPWGVFSLLAAATGPIKTWAALCRIWLLSVLLFFSLPNSKLLGYILPAVPSLVMLAAMGWDKVMLKVKHAERWFGVLVVLNLSLALVGSVFSMKYTSMVLSRDVATVLACEAARNSDQESGWNSVSNQQHDQVHNM